MVTRTISVIIYFLIYAHVKSLCSTPETNIIFYMNFNFFKKTYKVIGGGVNREQRKRLLRNQNKISQNPRTKNIGLYSLQAPSAHTKYIQTCNKVNNHVSLSNQIRSSMFSSRQAHG